MNNNLTAIAPSTVSSDSPIVASTWKPDWEEVKRHCQLLGRDYKSVRLRFINPVTGKAACKPCTPQSVRWYSDNGYNCYLVVNTGGDKAADIVECNAIWFEHDDLDKQLQETLWQTLGLPMPTFQINTGGASIHSYWVFDTPHTELADWKSLQSDLVDYAGADKSVKDISRVLRLAGGVYFKKKSGEPVAVSTIINATGTRYSFEDLRAIVPVPVATPEVKPAKVKPSKVKHLPPVDSKPSQSGGISYADAIARIEALSGDVANYRWEGHNWIQDKSNPNKWRGCCPIHTSESGTSFVVSNNRWYCAGDNVGGTLLEYEAYLDGLPSVPEGKAFLDFVEAKFNLKVERSSARSRSQSPATAATSGVDVPPEGTPQEKQPILDLVAIAQSFCATDTNTIKYFHKQKSFFLYQQNHWERVDDFIIKTDLTRWLTANNYLINADKKVKDLVEISKSLVHGQLDDNNKFLPFLDGCLNLSTFRFVPHSADIGNLFTLPRNYLTDEVETPTIDRFFKELTNNNEVAIAQIESFMAATLRRMSTCQKFLHLLGSAGSGKGTFLRLLTALVGSTNTHTSSLGVLENDKFEAFNLINKLLVTFPDEHKIGGNLNRFLSLSGGDELRCEEKHKQSFSIPYRGMVAIASNYEVFVTDAMDAVHRRRILISCNHKPATPDPFLDQKLQAELPALTKRLLALSEEEILRSLNLRLQSPEVWESRVNSNSVAAWMDEHVIFDPNHKAVVGRSKDEVLGDSGIPLTLFGSYSMFCRQGGYVQRSLNNFSQDVILTARTFFNKEVVKGRSNQGKYLQGIRLRLAGEATLDEECTPVPTRVYPSADLKPFPGKESADRVFPDQKVLHTKKPDVTTSHPPLPLEVLPTPPDKIESKKLSPEVYTVGTTHTAQESESTQGSAQGRHGCTPLLTIDDLEIGAVYLYLAPGNRLHHQCTVTSLDMEKSVITIQFEDSTKEYPYPEQLGRVG